MNHYITDDGGNVPMNKLEGIVTKPAAGVMATRPTTAPIQKPRAEGFLPRAASSNTQHNPAAADAVLVVAKAEAANGPAPKALPALNPNQPNHSKPVPKNTKWNIGRRNRFFDFRLISQIDGSSQVQQNQPTCVQQFHQQNQAHPT